LFKRYHDLTMAVLTGFMIGSLRAVWPWKEVISTRINSQGHEVPLLQVPTMPATFDSEVLFAFGLAVLGMVVVISLERLANQQGHQAEALS
jgi:putative membrane protein